MKKINLYTFKIKCFIENLTRIFKNIFLYLQIRMSYWMNNYNASYKKNCVYDINNKTLNINSNKHTNSINNIEYSELHQNDTENNIEYYSDSDEEELFQSTEANIMVNPGNYDMRQTFERECEELVYSKQRIRNIRIILLILGLFLIGTLITVLVVVLMNTTDPGLQFENESSISLDDFLSGTLRAKIFNGSWSSGNANITYRHEDIIIELDVVTRRKTVLLELKDKLRYSTEHQKSADGKFLLFARDPFKIFRHSFTAFYYVLNLDTQIVNSITINGEQKRLVLAKWSPTGNALILNYNGNLYYKPFAIAPDIKLTHDADVRIINGIPDWVYEEEVFSSNEAVWFSKNGNKIAYVQFNDVPTHIMNLPYYGESGTLDFQYPIQKPVSYPKAGSPNPYVKCFQIDLKSSENGIITKQPIPVPSELNTDDHIITVVNWLDNDLILSIWMNRVQNEAYLQISSELKRYQIYSIKSETGWVDLFKPPLSNRNGSQIALILPHNQGNTSGDYRHLSLLSTREKNQPIPLTSGQFVVQSILYWDYDTNLIFYMANQPNRSEVLHLYAVTAYKSGDKPQCITCSIKENGVAQTYFSAQFSDNGNHIVINSLGPSIPRVSVYEWMVNSGNIILKKNMDWESNDNIRQILPMKSVPTTEIHTINIGDGFEAKILLQLPPNLDRTGSKKYPLLVDVYGGPDSYSVVDIWNIDWGSYLVSNLSIIYAKIDGRGSGLRGDKLLHSIYLSLGTAEINDQINVTRKLQENLPFIDSQHTGIWGWSYGGYASGMALAKDDNNIFKCAASVAPVTDWLYYDSIYTERYMKTPDQNKIGYTNSRLSTMSEHFRGKNYLLIHGTLDDNVHYQQAMILAKNLERNDILFKQISYPDEDHGLANVRPHLYHSLDKFFVECFGLEKKNVFTII